MLILCGAASNADSVGGEAVAQRRERLRVEGSKAIEKTISKLGAGLVHRRTKISIVIFPTVEGRPLHTCNLRRRGVICASE